MEERKRSVNTCQQVVIGCGRLNHVPDIHKGTNHNHKSTRSYTGNQTDNVVLYIAVDSACDLLQFGDSTREVSITCDRLQYRNPEIKFLHPNNLKAPLHVMVPKLLVPVM